jgi:hypothetical protein
VKLGTHKSTAQEVAVKIMRLPLAGQNRNRPLHTPAVGPATSGSGVSTAAASSEIDVFKEIEILKTLDQCVTPGRQLSQRLLLRDPASTDALPACLPTRAPTPARPC